MTELHDKNSHMNTKYLNMVDFILVTVFISDFSPILVSLWVSVFKHWPHLTMSCFYCAEHLRHNSVVLQAQS